MAASGFSQFGPLAFVRTLTGICALWTVDLPTAPSVLTLLSCVYGSHRRLCAEYAALERAESLTAREAVLCPGWLIAT